MQRLPYPHITVPREAIRFTLANKILPMGQLTNAGVGQPGFKPVGPQMVPNLGVTAGSKNVNLAGPGGRVLYPLYPSVRLKPLPFYDVIGEIQRPTLLLPKVKTYFKFNFTPKQAQDIAMSREFHDGKMEYRVQVQARFCYIDPTCEQNDKLPPQLIVTVNGTHVQLPEFLPCRRGTEPKRADLPIDITALCRMSASMTNHIEISWGYEIDKSYCVSVKLVKKLTSDILLNRLNQFGNRNANHTRAFIRDKLKHDDDDCEIATTSLRVSLIDPLLKTRMKIPCRTESCTHLQCFDAKTFLMMNEKKARWNCPVCDKPTRLVDLYIDGFISQILQFCHDADEIEFSEDGSWKAIREEEDVTKDKQYSMFPSSGRGTPASDVPKNEELIDLISDDEDEPPPMVEKSPLPHDISKPYEDITAMSSQPASNGSQYTGGSVAQTTEALPVPEDTLSGLAGTLEGTLNELTRMSSSVSGSLSPDELDALDSRLADLSKNLKGLESELEQTDNTPELVPQESQSTKNVSRPPSSLSSRRSSKNSQEYNSESDGIRTTGGEDIIRSSSSSRHSSQLRRILSSSNNSVDSDSSSKQKKTKMKKTTGIASRVLDDTSSDSFTSQSQNKSTGQRTNRIDSDSSATNSATEIDNEGVEETGVSQLGQEPVRLSKDSVLSKESLESIHTRNKDSDSDTDIYIPIRNRNRTHVIESDDSDSNLPLTQVKKKITEFSPEHKRKRIEFSPEMTKKNKDSVPVKTVEKLKINLSKINKSQEPHIKMTKDYVQVGGMKYLGKLQPLVKVVDLSQCKCKNCDKYKGNLKHVPKYPYPETSKTVKSSQNVCDKIIPEILDSNEDTLASVEKEHQTETVNDLSETVEYGTDTSEDSFMLDFSDYSSSSSSSGSDWEIEFVKKFTSKRKIKTKDKRKKRRKTAKAITNFREAREKWLKKKAKALSSQK